MKKPPSTLLLPKYYPARARSSDCEPFGFARAPRDEHDPERAGSPRHDHLVGKPLVGAKRSFRGEEIRNDVSVLFRGAGGGLRIRLVEDAKRKQPQHGSGQRHHYSIASSLDRAPAQGREDADRAEPTHHIVADGDNRRRFGIGGRPFDTE